MSAESFSNPQDLEIERLLALDAVYVETQLRKVQIDATCEAMAELATQQSASI